jgi:MFS family permease
MKKSVPGPAVLAPVSLPAGVSWRDRSTWRPLARLSAVLFCVFLATGMINALVPLRVADVTHDYGRLAVVTTVYAGAGILAGYGWGWLADRFRRRTPFVMGGLAGVALAYTGYLLAGSFAVLLVVRALEGASLAAYNVGSVALIGDHVGERADRGRLLGAYRTFGSLAFGITMLTSGTIADRLGPLVPFALSAGFAGLGFLLAVGLREAPSHVPPASGASTGRTAEQPHGQAAPAEPAASLQAIAQQGKAARVAASLMVSLLIGVLAWHVVMTAVYSVWPNYLASVGYSRAAITRLWALASLSEVPFMLLTGYLADRLGRRQMLALAMGVIALVFLGYVTVPQLPWIGVVQVVRALAYASFLTASLAITVEATTYARRGRISGLVNTVGAIGDVSGAGLGGSLVKLAGFAGLLWAGTAAAFAGAVLVLAARYWPFRPGR